LTELIKTDEVKTEIMNEVTVWVEQLNGIEVVDQATYESANSVLKESKSRQKAINDRIVPIKAKAYASYKAINDLLNEALTPLKAIEKKVKGMVGDYLAEVQRKHNEEIEAERKRIEDARLAEASMLEVAGLPEEAEQVIEKRVSIPAAISTKPEMGGTYIVKLWSAEVIDFKALCRAVIDGKVDQSLILPNTSILNQLAKQQKENFNIPGVKANVENSVRSR